MLDMRRVFKDEAGFTLAEIAVAGAILAVALVALLAATTTGFTGISSARQSSTAVFLAEQRLEQARAFALSTASGQGFANLNTTNFPSQSYGAIAGYGNFRRDVAVTDSPGGVANTRLVRVTVFYRSASADGLAPESSIQLSTLIALR
jgi:Tfp pilus assembly protein PilV